jgi:hypothetical protein
MLLNLEKASKKETRNIEIRGKFKWHLNGLHGISVIFY